MTDFVASESDLSSTESENDESVKCIPKNINNVVNGYS